MQSKRYISRYISIIYRHSQLYIYNRLKHYGIGRGQQSLLLMLFDHGVMTQEQFARALKKDKANIARSIEKLEKEGYVRRERSETDKRSYDVTLTDKAYEIKEELIGVVNSWADSLTKDMNKEEQEQAIILLKKMVENSRKADLCCKEEECLKKKNKSI